MKIMVTLIFLQLSFFTFAPSYDIAEHNLIRLQYEQAQKEQVIKRILQTLSYIESSNDNRKKGRSGEIGTYQFTKTTWNYWCLKTVGRILDINNPAHQVIIADQKVRILLYENHYTLEQLAAFWNCGSPEYKGKRGRNKYGVRYDVPKYVDKFVSVYNSNN